MSGRRIQVDDPTRDEIKDLLEAHLRFARRVTPPGHVHALDAEGLLSGSVTLYSLVEHDHVLAIGALRELDDAHGEIKSMHTASNARRRGLGRAMLEHLLHEARRRGYRRRVSLETGTMEAFAPARQLYERHGFQECEPFGDYRPVPNSVCMTLRLDP